MAARAVLSRARGAEGAAAALALALGAGCAARPPDLRARAAQQAVLHDQELALAAAEYEPELAALVEKEKLPGIFVGLVADGKLVWSKALGAREIGSKAPVDADTVFRIASMSKSFVALSILQLRDEGKLSLDDPAERYLPELAQLKYPTTDSPRITVRQLLSHSAGFPEDNASADLRMSMSEASFDALLASGLSFANPPGTRFEYSNLGFALLGRIVARVSGARVQDYVGEHLLKPLGMEATRWDGAQVPAQHKAHGYGRKGAPLSGVGLSKYTDEALHEEPEIADGAWAGLGGLWTSGRDYAKWVAFNLAAWPPRDGPEQGPVRRASVREAHTAQRAWTFTAKRDDAGTLRVVAGGYGLGWAAVQTCAFEQLVTHAGGLPGYGSFVALLPQQGVGAFAFANLTYFGGMRAVRDLLERLQQQGLLRKRATAPSPELLRARDEALALLRGWDGDRAARLFDRTFAFYKPLERLRDELASLRRQHGACALTGDFAAGDALRGEQRLSCEHGALQLALTLTSEAPPRVQSLSIEEARGAPAAQAPGCPP